MHCDDPFAITRNQMVQDQILSRGISDVRILDAFRKIPRHLFVPEEFLNQAYADRPLPIGYGQTISQPYIVALMSHFLDLHGDEKVLEIGTGSGYQTAILAFLASVVYSVEIIKELSENAAASMDALRIENVHLSVGDGSIGLQSQAPYDRIIITAAVPMLSMEIQDQLAVGGKIIAPVGDRSRQTLELWVKDEGRFVKNKILPVVFVPLRGEQGWQD
jgi:protein-L-isoaspartate(D-aspartate) O-methyltransferase